MQLCVRYMCLHIIVLCLHIIVFLNSTHASSHRVASSAYARGRQARDILQLRLAFAQQIRTKITDSVIARSRFQK